VARSATGRRQLVGRLFGVSVAPPIDVELFGGMVHHRDLRGGGFRAAIFGVSDGLVSNISLVLGTAAAHPGAGVVRLAGLAGLLGGSFSMAAGEYVSMRGQQEALERELDVERGELSAHPVAEQRELEAIYRMRGVSEEVAHQVVEQLMASPEQALQAHARDELGIDPGSLGSPPQAAISSFLTFALGALVPLIPFLGGSAGSTAVFVAIGLAAAAAVTVGATIGVFTGRSKVYSALRSLGICAVAGAVTYAIGSAIGVAAH
jgi:VIT1/CCC1 family predicted Fe2+/Mn2+ transporter